MAKEFIKLEVKGVEGLRQKVDELSEKLDDLSPLFEQFSADFYKDQKRHYQLKGPGQYEDLSDDYAIAKERKYGFIYPILFASGRLAASLLSRSSRDSINIIRPKGFIIGTAVPYAIYHNSDQKPRTKIPYRPLWDENLDSPMFFRWNRIANAYLQKEMDGAFK